MRLGAWLDYMTAIKRDKGEAFLQHTLDHLLKNLPANQPGTSASQVKAMLADNPGGVISKEVLIAAHGGNEGILEGLEANSAGEVTPEAWNSFVAHRIATGDGALMAQVLEQLLENVVGILAQGADLSIPEVSETSH